MLRAPTALMLLFLPNLVSRSATAQWLHYPSPGIPRTPDGKPNLSAPAPRTADGKPDLSGLWTSDKPATQDGPSLRLSPATLFSLQ